MSNKKPENKVNQEVNTNKPLDEIMIKMVTKSGQDVTINSNPANIKAAKKIGWKEAK